MRMVCWQTILMKYHTLFFLNIRIDVAKFVIDTLRIKTFIHWFFYTVIIATVILGSAVVECLTRDRGAAGLSLTAVTVLCPWARHINPSLVLVQPKKTCPYITERLLMGCKESNQTKTNLTRITVQLDFGNHLTGKAKLDYFQWSH